MLCSSAHHSSFSKWCVLFFPDLLAIHAVSSKMIIIILYDNGDWPSHQAGQVILIQKIILSFHNARNCPSFAQVTVLIFYNARCCLSHPCAGHIVLVHRSMFLLHNIAVLWMAVLHHLEGPNFKSRDQLSLVGVHCFTQSPKHLPG